MINENILKEFKIQTGHTNIPVWFLDDYIGKNAEKYVSSRILKEHLINEWTKISGCNSVYCYEGLVKIFLYFRGYKLYTLNFNEIKNTKDIIDDKNLYYEKATI